jgi:stage II sporulation protein M
MKKKKRQNFLRENYAKSLKYIRESGNFIYAVLVTFLLFVLIGAFIPAPGALEQKILEIIEDLLIKTQGMSAGELIKFIFLNNLQSSFLGLFLGIFFGFFSLATCIINAYILGFVMLKSVQAEGALVLWRLLPHGIFELPALFISLGLGLKFGAFIFEKKKVKVLKRYFFESLRVFVFVVIPLLLIAAIIEGSLIFLLR